LADNKLAVELGYSLLLDALAQLDLDEAAFVRAVLAARAFLGAAYIKSAYDMMQLHGGIGYTWEHVAHLYYKRAAFGDLLFGGVDRQLDALGDLLLADARGPGNEPGPVTMRTGITGRGPASAIVDAKRAEQAGSTRSPSASTSCTPSRPRTHS